MMNATRASTVTFLVTLISLTACASRPVLTQEQKDRDALYQEMIASDFEMQTLGDGQDGNSQDVTMSDFKDLDAAEELRQEAALTRQIAAQEAAVTATVTTPAKPSPSPTKTASGTQDASQTEEERVNAEINAFF